jgi:hypothetical protein
LNGWITVSKELERMWPWPSLRNYLRHLPGGTEENYKNPVRIVSVLAKIQTRHIRNKHKEHYCLSQLIWYNQWNTVLIKSVLSYLFFLHHVGSEVYKFIHLSEECTASCSQRVTYFFYCEKKIKYKKKGLGNAHPALCSTVL